MRIHNTQHFKEARRVLRKLQTLQDEKLWFELRNSKLGFKFKRQESIAHYIVDFYCPAKKLIIEVDGDIHKNQIVEDFERTNILKKLGFRVIRFWNNEVDNNMDVVLEKIRKEL